MTKAIVESVDDSDYFILNGIHRPRTYEAIGVKLLADKQGVKIIPIQRNEFVLQESLLFDEYLIDGVVPVTQEDCISLLNQIVFKKGGGNGGGVAVKAGSMLFFKVAPNINKKEQEPGDYCMGFVEGQFINADYLGGDKTLLTSYNI